MITTLKNKKFNSLMDKIFGIQPALKPIKTPEKSDRQIANALGINHETVGKEQPRQSESKAVSDEKTDFSEPIKENIPSYRQCNLKDFYSVIRLSFGMGIDYAMKDDNGAPLKSWFTIDDVVKASKKKGFLLMASQAKNYLESFVRQNYFEKRESISGIEYRRKTWFIKL